MLNRDVGNDCDRIEPLLGAWHDGELGAEPAARVVAHLASCPGCAARVAELEAVDGALALAGELPEVDLGPAVLTALRRERRRTVTWRLATAAAVVMASGLGLLAGSLALGPRGEPQPPVLVATLDSVAEAFAPAPTGGLSALSGDLAAAGRGGRP